MLESRTLPQSFASQNPAPYIMLRIMCRGSLSGFVQLFIFEFSTWLFRRSDSLRKQRISLKKQKKREPYGILLPHDSPFCFIAGLQGYAHTPYKISPIRTAAFWRVVMILLSNFDFFRLEALVMLALAFLWA